MLGPIEQAVVTALQVVLPAAHQVIAGPPLTPPTASRIGVHARKLAAITPQGDGTSPNGRRPAYLSRSFTLPPDLDPADATNRPTSAFRPMRWLKWKTSSPPAVGW